MNAMIQQAADHLIKSKYAVVLTGAGISTESGIKGYRKNWARRIQKIYEGDLLTCPKCHGPMRIISFLENQDVIKKIFKHLGLWEVKPRPSRQKDKERPLYTEPWFDDSDSQLPASDNGLYQFTLIQDSRYVFEAERRSVYSSAFSGPCKVMN